MSREVRLTALVEELAGIEARLDPQSYSKHRRTADLITVAAILPATLALDLHVDRPLLLLGAMVTGLFLNRLPQWVTRWRLRREQERLFGEYSRLRELAESHDGVASGTNRDGEPKPRGGTV